MLEKKTDKLAIKDLKILAGLENNSRVSYNKIAKKVGLSKEVVLYRIRNLEKFGIIRKYITSIEYVKNAQFTRQTLSIPQINLHQQGPGVYLGRD